MKKCLLFLPLLIIISACSAIETEPVAGSTSAATEILATAERIIQTKTELNGLSLSWVSGDNIGMYADGIQNNCVLSYDGSKFIGYVKNTGQKISSVEYYAYYPMSSITDGFCVNGTLPRVQAAPFDGKADFMIADPIIEAYDEDDMPSLSFSFSRHLFSIVKVSITNNDPAIANDKLVEVILQASGKILSGNFSVDVSSSEKASPSFLSQMSSQVCIRYPDSEVPVLGKGVTHTVYAVVNSIQANNLKVIVKTDNHMKIFESSQDITFSEGTVVSLPVINFGSEKKKRTMLYWGDSIATTGVTDYLNQLLGPEWEVINGGVPGDGPLGIAGRQGAIPMKIQNDITIPGDHTKKVETGRLVSSLSVSGQPSSDGVKLFDSYWMKTDNHSLLNPATICGVECNFSMENDKYYVQRVNDGEDVSVPAGTVVYSYAATHYQDVDVSACYMGVNKGQYSTGRGDNYEILANHYQSMIDFTTSKNFIVAGFHLFGSGYWTDEYVNLFCTRFGDRFLDMRVYGVENAARLMPMTGIYSPTALDYELLGKGEWPASWRNEDLTNVHPNGYGSKAIAIMVYEKMLELGYLDY